MLLRSQSIIKFCDVIMVTFFGDIMGITSLKCRHNWFFKVRIRHIQLKKHNLAKLRNFSSPKLKIKGRWVRRAPSAWRFLNICY